MRKRLVASALASRYSDGMPHFQFSLARMLYALVWMAMGAAITAAGIRRDDGHSTTLLGPTLLIAGVLIFCAGIGVLAKSPWLGVKYALALWGALGLLLAAYAVLAWLLGLQM